jgi:hypothetical protein
MDINHAYLDEEKCVLHEYGFIPSHYVWYHGRYLRITVVWCRYVRITVTHRDFTEAIECSF